MINKSFLLIIFIVAILSNVFSISKKDINRLIDNQRIKKELLEQYLKENQEKLKTIEWGVNFIPAATSKEEYIRQSSDDSYFIKLAAEVEFSIFTGKGNANLFSFPNPLGYLDIGVCWWHSRFQRNALYLTYYLPDNPKPTKKEAEKIIRQIRWGMKVIPINGFKNFDDFSNEYKDLIVKRLSNWQLFDGIILWQWVNDLAGFYEVSPNKLKTIMDNLYKEIKLNKICYTKIQIKGLDSHAWLFTEMEKTENGYEYKIIDSNNPYTSIPMPEYKYGDKYLPFFGGTGNDPNNYKCVPYLQWKFELMFMKDIIKNYDRINKIK